MSNRTKQTEPLVGVNVQIPVSVHIAAKIACVTRGVSWNKAVAEALAAWAAKTNARAS